MANPKQPKDDESGKFKSKKRVRSYIAEISSATPTSHFSQIRGKLAEALNEFEPDLEVLELQFYEFAGSTYLLVIIRGTPVVYTSDEVDK